MSRLVTRRLLATDLPANVSRLVESVFYRIRICSDVIINGEKNELEEMLEVSTQRWVKAERKIAAARRELSK